MISRGKLYKCRYKTPRITVDIISILLDKDCSSEQSLSLFLKTLINYKMIITGKSADGSDAKIAKGVYESACGTFWSSKPITREQKAYELVWKHCERYRKSMRTLYNQLKSGSKENLPKWVRTWFINCFEAK